jgi:hypothetical protein
MWYSGLAPLKTRFLGWGVLGTWRSGFLGQKRGYLPPPRRRDCLYKQTQFAGAECAKRTQFPASRADNARAAEPDGAGLGPAFAKQVIERHGGRIWARNNPRSAPPSALPFPRTHLSGHLDRIKIFRQRNFFIYNML